MTPKPDIHPLAKTHLRELRERWGVEPTLEEALWIVRCCERVLNPCAGERFELAGIPERAGISDVWLWPIGIGAAIWYDELACAWWAGDRTRLTYALGYALAHSRDREALAACRERRAAEARVKAWRATLTCRREELEAAIDRVLPAPADAAQADDKSARRAVMDWGGLVADIEAATGIAADHWLWDVSRARTLRAWHAARQIIAAQGGRAGHAGPSPEDEAVADLAKAKHAIIAAHAAEVRE